MSSAGLRSLLKRMRKCSAGLPTGCTEGLQALRDFALPGNLRGRSFMRAAD